MLKFTDVIEITEIFDHVLNTKNLSDTMSVYKVSASRERHIL